MNPRPVDCEQGPFDLLLAKSRQSNGWLADVPDLMVSRTASKRFELSVHPNGWSYVDTVAVRCIAVIPDYYDEFFKYIFTHIEVRSTYKRIPRS